MTLELIRYARLLGARSGVGRDSSATSERFWRGGGAQQQNGFGGAHHTRFGSLSDSLRHGDLKYAPNGELRANGTSGGNVKVSLRAFRTRSVK